MTKILVVLNVVIYLITVAQGAGLNSSRRQPVQQVGALRARSSHHGDWWRLITSAFLHGGLLHITFNMLALWWLGAPVEMVLGRARYLGLYLVSGLAGATGALIADPNSVTVGASGAIFGLLGAGLDPRVPGDGLARGQLPDPDRDQPGDQLRRPGHLGRRPPRRPGRRDRDHPRVHAGRADAGAEDPAVRSCDVFIVGAIAVGIAYFKVRGLA